MDGLVLCLFVFLGMSIRRQPGRGTELRGVLALVVLFHHFSLLISDGVLLGLFHELGKPAVAAFLFLSGYGVMRRFRFDPQYLHRFLPRRLTKLWLPYGIVALLSFLLHPLCHGSWYGLSDLLDALRYGDPIVSNGWYVFFLTALYLLFWLCAKLLRRPFWITAAVGAATLLWIPLCRWIGWGDYWYASGPAFALGLLRGIYDRSPVWPLHWNNPLLAFLGRISYEIYLIHGLLLLLLRAHLSHLPLALTTLLLTLTAATLLHKSATR